MPHEIFVAACLTAGTAVGGFAGAMLGCTVHANITKARLVHDAQRLFSTAYNMDAGRPAANEPMPGQQ